MPNRIHTIDRPNVAKYCVTCDLDDNGGARRVVVDVQFIEERLSLLNPYDLEACHQILVGDPSQIEVYDIRDDQWETKKYKLEFVNGEGAKTEIWAEKVTFA